MAGANNHSIKVGLKAAGKQVNASEIASLRERMGKTSMTVASAMANMKNERIRGLMPPMAPNRGSSMGAASRSTLGGAGAARSADANAKFKAEQAAKAPKAEPAAKAKARPARRAKVEHAPGSHVARLLAPKAPSAKSAAAHDDAVLSAVRAAAARQPAGSLLGMRDVRGLQKLDKASFDAAALRLQSAGKIVLHHHDAPHFLSDAARSQLVKGANGYHYEGIALRRGQ